MRALVIGASGGIGAALVAALRDRGAVVDTLSRRDDGLDVTDEGSVRAALAPLPDGAFDLVLIATGALEIDETGPEKTLRAFSPEAFLAQVRLNALGPALVLKHGLRLIPRDRPAAMVALSARVGSIGDNGFGGWYSYRASKAALNQLIRTAAIEVARSHPQAIVAALHPGTVATPLTRKFLGRHPAVEPATAAARLLEVIDGLTPEDTGSFRDHAGKQVPW